MLLNGYVHTYIVHVHKPYNALGMCICSLYCNHAVSCVACLSDRYVYKTCVKLSTLIGTVTIY